MLQPDDPENKLLLLKIAEGDETAFRELFRKYAPVIHVRLCSIIKCQEVKDDIIQETFLRVWYHRDQLPDIEHLSSWLLSIAYNRAFTYLRDQAIREKALGKIKIRETENNTQESVDLHLLNIIIAKAVAQLPPQQKKIYLLNREQGLLISEISHQLKLSPQTIKNSIGLALKSIRLFLEANGHYLAALSVACL